MELRFSDFSFPGDLARYTGAVREMVRTELEPLAEEIEKTNKMPGTVMTLLRNAGLHLLTLPRDWGGAGLTLSQFWPIEEEIAKAHGTIRVTMHAMANKWMMLYHCGTEEQKNRYLPLLVKGEYASFALTEPEVGTGVDIRTTARKDDNSYCVNGTKHLITWANMAVFFHVVAYTGDRSLGARGISVIIVDAGTPGLAVEPMKDAMGLRGCYHGIVHFRDCCVPTGNLLGKEGEGLDIALRTFLDPARVGIAVDCLGACEAMLEHSTRWAQTRVTFGKPIAERQATQQMLGDMATDVYALRSMIADCAQRYDHGEPIAVRASMCKLFGLEAVKRVSDQALTLHGGLGYTSALPVERIYRDARSLWFEEGTPTIQRLVIGRDVLGKRIRQIGR